MLLLLFPFGMAQVFGIPQANSSFYPTILGAVIFGIGISLLLEVLGFIELVPTFKFWEIKGSFIG